MLLLAATLLAVLLVPPLGGRLRALSGLRLHAGGLLCAALALQVLALVVLRDGSRPLLVTMHAGSYVLAGYFVWCNRATPGVLVLAVGAGSNALGLALNHGTLPASARALRAAGLPAVAAGYSNNSVLGHPHLAWLGDVFASPSWLPLRNVYSPGDLLILAGVVWAVHRTCGTVLARDPRPALRGLRRAVPVLTPDLVPAPGQPVAAGVRAASQPGRSAAGMGRLSR